MAISDAIRDEITRLSNAGKQDPLYDYLKEKITSSEVSPEDMLDYASRFKFTKKPGKPYVINADLVNKLGVVVGSLSDELKHHRAAFFCLAAMRGSIWGNRNYAQYLLDTPKHQPKVSKKKILAYAQKAVDLADESDKGHHCFILMKALRRNKKYLDANVALGRYIEFHSRKVTSSYEKVAEDAKTSIKLTIRYIKKFILPEFQADISEMNDGIKVKDSYYRSSIKEINALLDISIDEPEFMSIKQELHYLQGRYLEALLDFSGAWCAYCRVDDQKIKNYSDVIAARIRLLKQEARRQIGLIKVNEPVPTKASIDSDSVSSDHDSGSSASSVDTQFRLPGDVDMPLHLLKHWQREAPWFDSVDQPAVTKEYEKRLEMLEDLKAGNRVMRQIITESLQHDPDAGDEAPLAKRAKHVNDDESAQLERVGDSIYKAYKAHCADDRRILRRHKAEIHFFSPARSRKKEQLVSLLEAIIDQRYKLSDDGVNPIDLSVASGRLLITAERLFQESIVSLSGQSSPMLGIPVVRKNPWETAYSSGHNLYGPVEAYTLSQTEIQAEHRVNPKLSRLGDSYLPQHGTYSGSVYRFIRRLCNNETEKEKQCAGLMLRYGRNHQSVSLEDLKQLSDEVEESDVDRFNQLCFLVMAKEQSQWHVAREEKFHIGMSVSFARCLMMIEAGFIRFDDALKNNALFSVYSHTGLVSDMSQVRKSAKYIDTMYMAYLQQQNSTDAMSFFRKYIEKDKPPTAILSRSRAHEDLLYAYGGESDSDGEGYETDLSI